MGGGARCRRLICDLLWSDPEEGIQGWGENERGVSFTFGADVVEKFLRVHDLDLICRARRDTTLQGECGSVSWIDIQGQTQ